MCRLARASRASMSNSCGWFCVSFPASNFEGWWAKADTGSEENRGAWSTAVYILAVCDLGQGTSLAVALMVKWAQQQQCLSPKVILKVKRENAWKVLHTMSSWLRMDSPGTDSETNEHVRSAWGVRVGRRKREGELGLQCSLNKGLRWTHKELWSYDSPSELSHLETKVFIRPVT